MPGNWCSVAVCRNHSNNGKELVYFRFPKDSRISKKWLEKCRRKDPVNLKNARVCSAHFLEDDFDDVVKSKIMNTHPKVLKPGAIPSINITPVVDSRFDCNRKSEFFHKRKSEEEASQRKIFVDEIMNEEPQGSLIEDVPLMNIDIDDPDHPDVMALKEKIKELDEYNSQLLQNVHELEKLLTKEKSEKMGLSKKLEVAYEDIRQLKAEIKKETSNFGLQMKEVLKPCLSENQIDIILNKKNRAIWTSNELAIAFTLRYFSQRAYVYLRQTLHYPLPGLSTLRKWACNIDLKSGTLSDVIQIMKTAGRNKSPMQNCTVLSFDEMKVSAVFEYDKKEDSIVGPHNYMQVVMARGLFDSWKQPVYVNFDQKMTKSIICEIIVELHDINFTVVACVSDCGGGNQGLWKELGVTTDSTSFFHPVTKEQVYMFADVPHLLKLTRNWFLDGGFLINGQIVNKTPVEVLIQSTNQEVSSCYKLTPLHITCEKAQRQNVKLASQLFSHTTATALKRYLPGDDKDLARRTSDFIELINWWFDILNSYTTHTNLPSKKPYGKDLESQDEVLRTTLETVQNMICIGKKSMQTFQKGILISTKSLMSLLNDLKSKYGAQYLLTHRLNQDCLENFFSQLRTRGGLHDHPAPLNSLYRIRSILLGKNPGLVSKKTNVEVADAEFITAKALLKAKIDVIDEGADEDELLIETIEVEDIDTECEQESCEVTNSNNQSEGDGIEYLAGYLAKKFSEKYPSLGAHTYKSPSVHIYAMPSWVQHLSFGGLIEPSSEWLSQVSGMERLFNKFHHDSFSVKKSILHETVNFISVRVEGDIPSDLIKAYCLQRIFIRIKFLNSKNEKAMKRHTTSSDPKLSKKMRKTIV